MSVRNFLGGSPLGVAIRLLILCVVVGAVLSFLGLTPRAIVAEIMDAARAIWNMGYEAFDRIIEYFLVGAVIVLPIWLVSRLIKTRN